MIPDFGPFELEEHDALFHIWELLESGPLPLSELAELCRSDGVLDEIVPQRFPDDLEAVDLLTMGVGGIWSTRADVVARLDRVMEGTVFTHRLTDMERVVGTFNLDPDFSVIDMDVAEFDEPLRLHDRRELFITFPDLELMGEPTLVGPEGWLDRFDAGDLLAFRKGRDGRVSVDRIDETAEGSAEAAAISSYFYDARVDEAAGFDFMPLLTDVVVTDPDLFRGAVAPIGELLASVGLEHRDGHIGPADTDWLPPGVLLAQIERASLSEAYGFDACCDAAFDTMVDAWRGRDSDRWEPTDATAIAKTLDHGEVGEAFVEWVEHCGGELFELDDFLSDVAAGAGRHGASALQWVARIRFWEGEMSGAQEAAHGAIALDPGNVQATALLGHIAAIRGDSKEALRLLRRSAPGDPWIDVLSDTYEPFPDAKRNDPCPCGSGRKFKVCCAVDPQLTGSQRTRMLTYKLYRFAADPSRVGEFFRLADIARSADERNDAGDLDRFLDYPFIPDIGAFEGAIEAFAILWGSILPDDERDTAGLWALSDRRMWEVTDEPAGPYITLRDTQTGDIVTVFDETASQHLRPGKLILARVAPAFGEDRIIGEPVAVDIRHRDLTIRLLDGSPTAEDFAHWYGLLAAPPHLQTTEGQPMVLCRAVCVPVSTTWNALETALDTQHERVDDTMWQAFFVNRKGETVVRGMMTREGKQLVIETNAEERLDAIIDALPGIEVVEESRLPITSPRDFEHLTGTAPESEPIPPEARDALAAMMREKEEAWLDEEIPLLDGLTPRQAAADPTRREDLVALLTSFEQPVGEGMTSFDPDRLRRLLGLD